MTFNSSPVSSLSLSLSHWEMASAVPPGSETAALRVRSWVFQDRPRLALPSFSRFAGRPSSTRPVDPAPAPAVFREEIVVLPSTLPARHIWWLSLARLWAEGPPAESNCTDPTHHHRSETSSLRWCPPHTQATHAWGVWTYLQRRGKYFRTLKNSFARQRSPIWSVHVKYPRRTSSCRDLLWSEFSVNP